MNGYEHYQRAEELLAAATRTEINRISGIRMCFVSREETQELSQLAAVHATLALAAATADAIGFKKDLYAGNGEELPTQTRTDKKTERMAAAALAFLDDDAR